MKVARSFFRTLARPLQSRELSVAAGGMASQGRGLRFAHTASQVASPAAASEPPTDIDNPLRTYFDKHSQGAGIWKWLHYFEIYHRHFQRFVGRDARVMEIGIYSGGSLQMWRSYFGAGSSIYGVDIQEECNAYSAPGISILIGDQGSTAFWENAKKTIPPIDILIDDGSHDPEHQIVTLESMLPHISPGGVYLCEDIRGERNQFASYLYGLSRALNARKLGDFTAEIDSIHFYPFVAVIEKRRQRLQELADVKRGTEWQPFLS